MLRPTVALSVESANRYTSSMAKRERPTNSIVGQSAVTP
jgi:hypothetical protein